MRPVAGRTQRAPAVLLQPLPTCLSLLALGWVHLHPTLAANPTRVALHLPSRTSSPRARPGQPGIKVAPTCLEWVPEGLTAFHQAIALPG